MEQKKQRVTKYLETIIYGMTGMVFAAAFFFGILYPDMGISGSACCEQESSTGCEQENSAGYNAGDGFYSMQVQESSPLQISDLEEPFGKTGHRQRKAPCRRDDVIYASYFYECLTRNEP